MDVFLVGAQQSNELIAAAVGRADAAFQDEARRVLRMFHDRHIGISPRFALELAKGFSLHAPDYSNPVRLALYRRLLDSLDGTDAMKQDPRQFDHIPRHMLYDLCLLPLAGLIVEEMAQTYLFSFDSELALVPELAFDSYADRFENLFFDASQSHGHRKAETEAAGDKWALFFERCAHQLWGEVQRTRQGGVASVTHMLSRVYCDDVLLRMLYGLVPKPKFALDPGRRSFELTEEQNPLLSHPKQGGVVGIHTSSRLEDVEDMLVSEFLLPPQILADKLLNSSFFARHRPPPLNEQQQVMLMGTCLDDGDDAAVALVKASWLEAVFRMAIALFENDLLGSEIRFGQWREGAGLAASGIRVGDYKSLQNLNPFSATRFQMHRFFCDAGWLPGFLSVVPTLDADIEAKGNREEQSQHQDMQMLTILDALFPEANDPPQEDKASFSAAMVVVIRKSRMESSPIAMAGINWLVPVHGCVIDCPDQLLGGGQFVVEDGHKSTSSLTIAGDEGKPASREALNQISAELIAKIMQFYWERVNG
ncbi:hypothetical protein [uncultured Cohaesibacter sp.]|uniref:hypothetical protein n=1 Tax=uncultured Cohaesibacter sp. TaxID=1002546 RepID=UPI00292F75DF|nr:hypothetical protein [uncultured Cohaesibacter sp.]